MVRSYDVKHVDISESEGYCGQGNNIDLQNLLVYHHFAYENSDRMRPKSYPFEAIDGHQRGACGCPTLGPVVLWIQDR